LSNSRGNRIDITNTKHLLVIIAVVVVLIIVFMIMVDGCSTGTAGTLRALKKSGSEDDVWKSYEIYKEKAKKIDEEDRVRDDSAVVATVKEQLLRFKPNPTKLEIEAWKERLPPMPISLNLIVVPDLSKRIIDETNNPGQAVSDVKLLKYIFKAFEQRTKFKMNTKDRLIVDVTDGGQAAGRFRTLADSMIIDLSENKNAAHRKYFENYDKERFAKNIDSLYALALQYPRGADYVEYFSGRLPDYIQESDLFSEYKNLLILITDGYLEPQHGPPYSGSNAERFAIAKRMTGTDADEKVVLSVIKFPEIGRRFPTVKVLVLEVRPRTKRSPQEPFDSGTPKDYDILRILWKDWFKRLGMANAADEIFIRWHEAERITKGEIDKFLDK